MSEYTILPLINAAFQPGEAKKMVDSFEDRDFQEIARAEYYYFTGQAEECNHIAERYLMSHNIKLKMSSCLLYVYSNLTLGREAASRKGLREIQECLEKETKNPSSAEDRAVSVFAGYMSSVLLHLLVDELPDVELYAVTLPPGIKLFSAYVIAHMAYLKGEYGRALGICEAALMFRDDVYPISMIYLYCMIAMCQMNLKNQQKAKDSLMLAWNVAKEDEFLEPFIEHHGLLQGLLESCIRKEDSKLYNKLSDKVIAFSRGWMSIHNPMSGNSVTDALSTVEFSIAMLASRDWNNQEIADYLGFSPNTVKTYLSRIYEKMNINKRDELKNYMLK